MEKSKPPGNDPCWRDRPSRSLQACEETCMIHDSIYFQTAQIYLSLQRNSVAMQISSANASSGMLPRTYLSTSASAPTPEKSPAKKRRKSDFPIYAHEWTSLCTRQMPRSCQVFQNAKVSPLLDTVQPCNLAVHLCIPTWNPWRAGEAAGTAEEVCSEIAALKGLLCGLAFTSFQQTITRTMIEFMDSPHECTSAILTSPIFS